jgi:hypothetical protein
MGKLVGIMDAVMSKWDRILRIGQEGVAAVIEEAVGEVPRGGQRQRQRLLQAQARMLPIPTCLTLPSLLEDLVGSGPMITSSGEGYRFILLVHG